MADPELADWCKRNGILSNGITEGFVSEGWRGIIATKDLQPGEVVLQVPERLLLTTRSAARDPQLAAALERHRLVTGTGAGVSGSRAAHASGSGAPELSPHQILACHLLLEVSRGTDSFWWPYLKQIPRSYTSLANFSAEDAAALQLQHACDVAAAAAERTREEWRAALPVLQDLGLPKRFTAFRAWLWASSTLHSRTMYLPWCAAGALTPFGDLHNYQPPPAPYTPQLGPPAAAPLPAAGARRDAGAAAAPQARSCAAGAVEPGCRERPGSRIDDENGQKGPPSPKSVPERLKALEPVRPLAAAEGGPRQNQNVNSPSSQCSCDGAAAGDGTANGVIGEGGGSGHSDSGLTTLACQTNTITTTAVVPASMSATDQQPLVERCTALSLPRALHGGAALSASAPALAAQEPVSTSGGADTSVSRLQDRGVGRLERPEADDGRCQDGRVDTAAGVTGGPRPPAAGDCAREEVIKEGDASVEDGSAAIAGDGMWDEAAQQYLIIVRRPYRRGEQVMLCYGRYTNLELLEHYGFVLQDNPHDTAQFDPELLPVPAGARLAAGAPYLAPADCFLHANGQPSWQLLHMLRYAAASPSERRSGAHLLAAGEQVSEQGDRQVLQWLHSACSRQLSALPTTLREDLALQRQEREGQQEAPGQLPLQPQKQPHGSCGPERQQQAPLVSATSEVRVLEAQPESPAAVEPPPPVAPTVGAAEGAAPGEGREVTAAPPSDGLTCAGLALQWRILQKEILHRALRAAEEVMGPGAASPSRACKHRDLNAIIAEQRRRRPDVPSLLR